MQNSESNNKLVFELKLKLSAKDFHLKLMTKKRFILSLAIVAAKLLVYALVKSSL